MSENIPTVKVNFILNDQNLFNWLKEYNQAQVESIKTAGVIEVDRKFYNVKSFCFDASRDVLDIYLNAG